MGPRSGSKGGKKNKEKVDSSAEMPPEKRSASTDQAESDDEPLTRKVIYEVIDELFAKYYSKTQDDLNKTISALDACIEPVTKIAENTLSKVDALEKELVTCKTDSAFLKSENTNRKKELTVAANRITAVEERIEERTNRQLRKTLVFKSIPYENGKKEETWEETEAVLRRHIAATCNMDYAKTDGIIERCHRSTHKTNYHGKNPEFIFALCYDWKDTLWLTDTYRKKNIAEEAFRSACEYKYGPLTTQRRNLALEERKKLKQAGTISNGYVAYPAKLMVRTGRSGKYELHTDFSKVKIEPSRRD